MTGWLCVVLGLITLAVVLFSRAVEAEDVARASLGVLGTFTCLALAWAVFFLGMR